MPTPPKAVRTWSRLRARVLSLGDVCVISLLTVVFFRSYASLVLGSTSEGCLTCPFCGL